MWPFKKTKWLSCVSASDLQKRTEKSEISNHISFAVLSGNYSGFCRNASINCHFFFFFSFFWATSFSWFINWWQKHGNLKFPLKSESLTSVHFFSEMKFKKQKQTGNWHSNERLLWKSKCEIQLMCSVTLKPIKMQDTFWT